MDAAPSGVYLRVRAEVTLSNIANSDRETFDALVATHYARLVRRLTVVVRDPEEAKDLAQATIERAFASRTHVDRLNFEAWLQTIGFRLALNELRRRRRRPWFQLRQDVADGNAMPDTDLWSALGELRREERIAIVWNVLDGYTQAEIASRLGVPEGTVASWVKRGKDHLRAQLKDET